MRLRAEKNTRCTSIGVMVEIGIVIGISKSKKGYNPFIKGNNDGYLTPEAARLGTEKESIYVSAQHSMIIHNKKALKLIVRFLKEGTFSVPER